VFLAVASVASAADAGPGQSFFAPLSFEGKAYPVLLSAEGRWLNWRDTYGAPRMRLTGGVWRQTGVHQGIDIYAEQGTPIVSISEGVIENVGWTFYSGYRVGVRGDDGRYYFYAHMLPVPTPGISQGARVSAGTLLGRMGSSGYGPEGTSDEFPAHLHFGLQEGSRWLNSNDMLKALYTKQTASIRGANERLRQLRRAVLSLRSRTSGPGAVDTAMISARIALKESQIRSIQAQLVM